MESRDSLRDLLHGGKAKPAPKAEEEGPVADESDGMSIAQMDGRYSSMRPANKNLTRMHIVKKDGIVETVQYHYSDVKGTFKGSEFTFVFAGTKHWQVTVKGHGPKFWAIYDYISLHRWPYLREAAGSMAGVGPDETVLTSIEVKDVTPREQDE